MNVQFGIDTWGLVGGTERYAAAIVPPLLERGHRITVLCREAHAPDFAPGLSDVPVVVDSAIAEAEPDAADRRRLTEIVEEVRPDLIFMHTSRSVEVLDHLSNLAPVVRFIQDHTLFCPGLNKYREDGEICTRPMGLQCLTRYWLSSGCICFKPSVHSNRILDPIRTLREKRRDLRVSRRARRILTNSSYMRSEMLQVGFTSEQVVVLPLFTVSGTPEQPVGELPPAVEDFLAGSDDPVLFTPARLTLPDKGVDYLLTALSKVEAPFRAVVAGSGPAEDWLRQKCEDDGLADRVCFAGWQGRGAIEALYQRADVVVCPSVWAEPWGLVGPEAMSHGKPVVAFRVGGIPEWLVDGETGFLCDRLDVGAMAASVDRLLADAELRDRMGAAARVSVAERWGRGAHMERLDRALHEAAGQSTG